MATLSRIALPIVSVFAAMGPTLVVADESPVILVNEDFDGFRPGLLTSVIGAHTEYHYLPDAAPKGRWAVSTFRSKSGTQRAWRVITSEGSPAMLQSWQNVEFHYHPILVTGDELWSDYRVTVDLVPQQGQGRSGVVFRYRNDRCYYFFGVEGKNAVLKLVQHATAYRKPYEKVLAEEISNWTPGAPLQLTVSVAGPDIRAELSTGVELRATDDTYKLGKVG
ncbi:hypothetical protein OAS39_13180, partial [Pirellulales bacterium]|nr:hypothetical protein [Pirellulales bacterium]